MRIRILRRCSAAVDGLSVAPLEVGRVYDIKPSTAAFLIATKCAEIYRESHPSRTGRYLQRDADAPESSPYTD